MSNPGVGNLFALTGHFQKLKVGKGRSKVWFHLKKIVISKKPSLFLPKSYCSLKENVFSSDHAKVALFGFKGYMQPLGRRFPTPGLT